MAYDPPQRDGRTTEGTSPFGNVTLDRHVPLADSIAAVLRHGRALWALAVTAMVLDIALTGIGLSMGLEERNPVALAAIESYGLLTAGVILKGGAVLVGYVCWRFYPGIHRGVIPLGLAIPSCVAVAINAVTIYSIL